VFSAYADLFPANGRAIDIACGRGGAALWLARRGMEVDGYDVSAVAIAQAAELAQTHGLATRCRFTVADLDIGLPVAAPSDVVLCNKFRDSRLDNAVVERLAPGGLLAISALSRTSPGSARFRVQPDELREAFAALDVIAAGNGWLVARKP